MNDTKKYYCNCTKKYEGENCDNKKSVYEITSCDFENGCPDFKYYSQNSYVWKTRSGPTPSYMTGPDKAHTGQKYGYIEASSPAMKGNKAFLQSKLLPVGGKSCVSLYYHMFGAGIGSLKIYVMNSNRQIIGKSWMKTGAQGNLWVYMSLEVNADEGILVVEGVRGWYWSGDIAVDDVKWMSGPCEQNIGNK